MCIVQDALSIMYCISSEMIRHLFQNWNFVMLLNEKGKEDKLIGQNMIYENEY